VCPAVEPLFSGGAGFGYTNFRHWRGPFAGLLALGTVDTWHYITLGIQYEGFQSLYEPEKQT
jgi:hypothetical protein